MNGFPWVRVWAAENFEIHIFLNLSWDFSWKVSENIQAFQPVKWKEHKVVQKKWDTSREVFRDAGWGDGAGGDAGGTRTSRSPSQKKSQHKETAQNMFVKKVSIFDRQFSASSSPQKLWVQKFKRKFLQLAQIYFFEISVLFLWKFALTKNWQIWQEMHLVLV